MEYGHTDLSSFWRGASGQIPQSRKSLLRRVIDFDYLSTLTKEERHGLLYAGHAFINAENASKGVPPVYPNTVMVHDVLQSYTNKQAQQHVDEFKELDNDRGRSVLADQGTEEMEEVLEGFAYFYKKWKFTSSIVSLKNCIEMNQVSLARVLLQYYKVSADEDLGHNFNLLHLAAMRNRPIFVPILVACGVGINQKGGNVGFTPLHEAIRAGSSETTVALLDAGADVEMYSDTFSNTAPFSPFELALECPNRSSKTVSLLLSRGAKYGHTTQSLASLETACRHPDILLTLLNHDPSLSRLETRKRTLLHAAVAANRPRSVQILLERGADVNVRDIAGRTPLAALSSINKLGSYVLNANFYVGLPVKHFDHEMWNPKSFDETQSLLIEYGGEEPDDYIYTVGERNMMIAVARYLYCLEHFGTGMLAKLSLSSLVQGLMAGKGVLDPSTMISIMAETLKDQKELAINMLASVHLLATSTQHLPVDSEVLGQKFTAKFKEYLAGWLKFVNWDEMMDLGLAIVRYAQDPVEPQTPLPEGIDDATVQEIFQEIQQASQNGKVMSFKSPESRLVLSWFLNAPVPDDIDAALNCLTSPYVPELAKGRSISEPTRLAFEQLAAAQKALKPGGEWDGIGDFASSFNNFLESIGPASITAPPTQLLPFHHTGNEDMTYQPSFLSDLSPHSLIWVCLPTESRLSRQARIFTPVALIAIFCLLLLWRVRNWIRWLTFSRVVSAILIHFIRDLIVAYPSLIPDITRFAPIIAVTGWLAKGSVWQMLLECHLTYGLFKYIFSEDSKDDLVLNQVRFRLRYGFPDAEPVIISHKSGAEWNYNFLDLYESMWGNYSLANFGIYDWVHRCDAVAALIDQWAAEEEQGLETSKKFWGRGWWFYIESENRWKKFDFLSEGTLPDRGKTMKAFEEIERMVHVKGCPELYQNFRKLFPDITTRDKYRELEELLRDHPDILYVVQGIWID
ncbi:uncharacterized protein LY89DRAFT_318256 [Mollisia scopiformis]|uniref:Uncharacterized protein n=1 Tax=Mollisia scopiformis TaxID=149040 RepID=A0A132BB04_MOLSC|nr:uncharacterized protein LY89DRAFT_318256 [Mollisia scopiformis]KUJ09024.1 hypothetical protein LY89DRAFT_318256 [Mollisia scopiformis]